MKILRKTVDYFNTPTKCFIPKCRARCCIDAPLPEGFLERFNSRIQRPIYSGLNIGINDPKDNFNSIVYNTRPIQLINIDRNTGKKIYGISKDMLDELQVRSMDDINTLLNNYEAQKIYNYCPFITDYGRCAVYEHRPPICREFGTSFAKVDLCPDKSSRFDIIKFYLAQLFNFDNLRAFFKNLKKRK